MKNLSEADLGYMAGFIDGDGYLHLRLYNSGYQKNHPRARAFLPILEIVNTNREVIEWFKKRLNTGVMIGRKQPHRSRRAYRLSISNKDILKKLLSSILPYLKVKERQAQLLLEFIKRHPPKQQNWTTLEDWKAFFEIRSLHGGHQHRIFNSDWIPPHTPRTKLDREFVIKTIKGFFKRTKITERELAEKVGYGQPTISHILHRHTLKPKTIYDISKVIKELQPLFVGTNSKCA